jgi:hypothetical protein
MTFDSGNVYVELFKNLIDESKELCLSLLEHLSMECKPETPILNSVKRTIAFTLLVTLGIALLNTPAVQAAGKLSTILNSTEVKLNNLKSVDFQIISSGSIANDLFLNGNRNRSSEGGYEVEVTSKTSNSYTLTFTPNRPIVNSQYLLLVSESPDGSPALELQVAINMDPELEGLFNVEGFSFECKKSGDYLCIVTPEISGDAFDEELEGWIPYNVEIKSRAKGTSKWSRTSYEGYDLATKASWMFSKNISSPTEVAVKIKYREKVYNLTSMALPVPNLSMIAPGSAIVGKNFTVQISGPKSYSGKCFVNKFQVQIKNGLGKISLYGKQPGNLYLFLSCDSSANWASKSQGRNVYIRD